MRRPRWVDLRFYAGSKADEVPRAMVVAGEEEPVEVVGSWHEASVRDPGTRQRRFRLRTADDARFEVLQIEGDHRWRMEDDEGTGPIRSGGQ